MVRCVSGYSDDNIYSMENIPKAKFMKFSHLPTFLLIIGYPVYWLELFIFNKRDGTASFLAPVLFLSCAILTLIYRRQAVITNYRWLKSFWRNSNFIIKLVLIVSAACISIIILTVLYAYLLPPHLSQEFDALNYHLSIPRQHLILGSFEHISWSSADLFPLPVDFALAPYWFATALPNKIPQFFFLVGLVLVAANLLMRLSNGNRFGACLAVIAIFGAHFIGIQMGTAMLDIALAYLFLAALDSFLEGNMILAGIEAAFYFWSKSFIPLQTGLIVMLLLFAWLIFKIRGFRTINWSFGRPIELKEKQGYLRNLKSFIVVFLVSSVIIAGPFLVKSWYYSGTPLYPFAAGALKINKNVDVNDKHWESITDSAKTHINAKDSYGHGRSFFDFVRHFWLIAVPEQGVNNSYDYPLGLVYLIFLGPFLWFLVQSLIRREFVILPFLIIIYWVIWWFGSQQTRFLYVPVLLMVITVLSYLKNPSIVFLTCLSFALVFNCLSVFSAYKKDLGLQKEEVLRAKDRELSRMSSDYLKQGRHDTVSFAFYDIAYARFPVKVSGVRSAWVLTDNK